MFRRARGDLRISGRCPGVYAERGAGKAGFESLVQPARHSSALLRILSLETQSAGFELHQPDRTEMELVGSLAREPGDRSQGGAPSESETMLVWSSLMRDPQSEDLSASAWCRVRAHTGPAR